jgi:CRP/FNR family transcriptional regulator, cyclic AMP receptor protein
MSAQWGEDAARRLGLIKYNGRIEVHRSLLNVVLNEKPEIKN